MTETKPSIEARILRAVKQTLAAVIRDTATPHGMRHPLSDQTIQDLRKCLTLISTRERELADTVNERELADTVDERELAGQITNDKPRFADEPVRKDKVIHIHRKKPADEPPVES